jgi:hypothetical protein
MDTTSIAMIAILVIAAALLMFFVFRAIFLWYWRIDEIVNLLHSINSKLDSTDKPPTP